MTVCPAPVRVSGSLLFEAPTPHVHWTGITRELTSVGPACCCCPSEKCRYVRLSTSLVAVTRDSDVALGALPMQAPPAARLPPTNIINPGGAVPQVLQRFVPYIKARAVTCEPVQRPIFFDLGQSLVIPWCEGSIGIDVAPNSATQAWVLNPGDGELLPMPGGDGQAHTFYDVWIWATAKCTTCCPEGSFAVLTDSELATVGGSPALFPVPPGAYEATVYVTIDGGTARGHWIQGTSVLASWVFANAGFGSRFPHTFGVVPGVSQLMVEAFDVNQNVVVAWKVRA